jgi:hypothetical protein
MKLILHIEINDETAVASVSGLDRKGGVQLSAALIGMGVNNRFIKASILTAADILSCGKNVAEQFVKTIDFGPLNPNSSKS